MAKSYFKQNYCHACHTRLAVFFPFPSCCVSSLIGNLSKDVFERRTSTGSEAFFLFICLDAIKFSLLTFFSLLKTIYPRVLTKPLRNDAKVHFRLTSVAQKRCCLSSLINTRRAEGTKTIPFPAAHRRKGHQDCLVFTVFLTIKTSSQNISIPLS